MTANLQLDAEERAQLIEAFVTETGEMLALLEELLLQLEASPDDEELLHEIFRAAHTIKGNAACLQFDELAAVAHVVEERLDRLRAGELQPTPECIQELFEEVDELRAAVEWNRVRLGHRNAARPAQRVLRVAASKLDKMLDLTGEIAIARGNLREIAGSDALHELDRLSVLLQELVMHARLVPVGPTLRPFHRIVRDVAASQGKRVALVIEGEEVEVDTAVLENLKDPVTHMVRNAIDHGIERSGTIRIRAAQENGGIVIRFSDDGRGLDETQIAARAKVLGIDTDRLSREELLGLIFEPGFSTAGQVSDLSGRGVGLDVVRKNVEALRGSVSVSSEPGRGTAITLRLPLTIAVIEGFAVEACGETYVIPVEAVIECLELPAQADGDAEGVLNVRGEPLPFLRLRKLFDLHGHSSHRENVVIVQHERGRAGIVVDELLGGHQTVMKPLQGVLRQLPGIAGSSILGNGRVALVLDTHEIIRRATNKE